MNEAELVKKVDKVCVGLATKLGIVGTIILGASSALTTILAGYHGHDTRLLATLATIVAVATILGRMAQAIAKEFAGGVTLPAITEAESTVIKGAGEVEAAVRKPTTRRRTP